MVYLSLVMLNPGSLQVLFHLIRIFPLQDLDVTLHLIGDSMQSNNAREAGESVLQRAIHSEIQGSCDFDCKT